MPARNRTRRRGGASWWPFGQSPASSAAPMPQSGVSANVPASDIALLQQAETANGLTNNGGITMETPIGTITTTDPSDPSKQIQVNKTIKTLLEADLDNIITALTAKKNAIKALPDQPWNNYLRSEVAQLSGLPNLAEQAISGIIGTYNMTARKRVIFGNKSVNNGYTCGSETCKQRGVTIKNALTKLASFSPESLASLGMFSGTSNLATFGARTLNPYPQSANPQMAQGNSSALGMQQQLGGRRTRRKR